jgi:hypothetical protein
MILTISQRGQIEPTKAVAMISLQLYGFSMTAIAVEKAIKA